jgi:predicted permease
MKRPRPEDFDREIQFHIEQLTQEKIALGIPPAQALREAKIEFGGQQSVKEDLRDVHRIPVFDAIRTHLRYAMRALRGSPSFSLTVIATLTLGIGANTAVFSAIDAVLLRPLPFPNAERLVVLKEYHGKQKNPESPVAPLRVEDWNRLNTTFQGIAGYYTEDTTDSGSGSSRKGAAAGAAPMKIKRALVTPRFLQVMGVSPALGQDFTSADEHFSGNAPANVLISDRFWREHFQSDPAAMGKPLPGGKTDGTVIGVLPAGFTFPDEEVELWYLVPPDAPYAQGRRNTWYTAIGRLKAGVTAAEGRANLDLIQRQLARQFPDTDADLGVVVTGLKEAKVRSSRASLWLLFGAVSILLLIACTNVSALVLARGMEREREFSLRASLGASRGTLMAQVLTESLLLAVAGAVAGLAVAGVAARILGALAKSIPRIGEVSLDWRLFLYTAGCAIFVAVVSGLVPAFRASLASPSSALARGGRSQISGGIRRPAQWVLVWIQVALAVCLLSGASLLLRSFQALSGVAPGFDAGHVLAFRVTGGWGETSEPAKLKRGIDRTLEALRALPGVRAAGVAVTFPGVPFQFPSELASPMGISRRWTSRLRRGRRAISTPTRKGWS